MCARIAGATWRLEVLLGLVLGELLELVGHVLVDRAAALARRDEVVAHHARLERALVAVERRAPRILRDPAGRPTMRCVQTTCRFAEVERRGLRVGDVRLARLVDEDAAGRADARRHAEVEHPAHHVEHVNAHVADDAVAVFHERAPAARMHQLVVRPHRRRAGPHLVVEVRRRRACRAGSRVARMW